MTRWQRFWVAQEVSVSLGDRWRRWRGRRRPNEPAGEQPEGPLREFVYLDDVAVYSLIASRKGAIASEFSDSETESLNAELSAGVGGGGSFGLPSAQVGSALRSESVRSSQVLRKAIVQATFKELRETESSSLLRLGGDLLGPTPAVSLDQLVNDPSLRSEGWVVDLSSAERGCVVEAEVHLEADPIFRTSAIVTTVREILSENAALFSSDELKNLGQLSAAGGMLESLLVGLVPVRGALVNYCVVDADGADLVVHRSLMQSSPALAELPRRDAVLVGVTERDHYWKDIRRVLFNQSMYTVFARLASSGLQPDWQPVKLVDLLRDVAPALGELVAGLGSGFLETVSEAAASAEHASTPGEAQLLLTEYLERLAAIHSVEHIEPSLLASVEAMATPAVLGDVDKRRPILKGLTSEFDRVHMTETSAEVQALIREAVLGRLGWGSPTPPSPTVPVTLRPQARPSFIHAELVAVYW